MNKIKDLDWLAGIWEGEGSFNLGKIKGKYIYPKMTLGMTDKDIVQRIARIVGANVNGPYLPKYPNAKWMYHISLSGKKAIHWMLVLFSDLGKRRQAKIVEVFNGWKQRPIVDNSLTLKE